MKQGNPKSILIIASLLLIHSFGFGFSLFQNENTPVAAASYTDIEPYADGFIAVTNNGRIDWISDKGKVTQTKKFEGEIFSSLLVNTHQVIVLGLHGQIFFFENDSSFYKIESQSNNSIKCLTLFKNKIIAGCENGEIAIGENPNSFKYLKLEVKGNIVSLSTRTKDCYGVTDQGEIIHTTDGLNWTIFDFNSVYKGFYKACNFVKIETSSKQIAVIGINEDNSPQLLFSSKGNVWTERTLNYADENGAHNSLSDIPTDIYYDTANDQFILTLTNGRLMTLPSCSHCQKIYKISNENFIAIAGNGSMIMIVGTNNYIKIVNADAL